MNDVVKLGVVRCVAMLLGCVLCVAAWANSETIPLAGRSAGFELRLNGASSVVFRAMSEGDAAAGNASSMVYMTPAGAGLAGLFAAIATHGTLEESRRQTAIEKAQKAADSRLEVFRSVISGYPTQELTQRTLALLPEVTGDSAVEFRSVHPQGWLMESMPVYFFNSDASAIVLENEISYRQKQNPERVFNVKMRVVSVPRDSNAEDYWIANEGEALKSVSAKLLSHSVDMLIKRIRTGEQATQEAPHRTYRYREGNFERVERAQFMDQTCDRVIVRTLRGWLLSFPRTGHGTASSNQEQSGNPAAEQGPCNVSKIDHR